MLTLKKIKCDRRRLHNLSSELGLLDLLNYEQKKSV